ncbi:MAG: hypothetical protein FIA92_05305 [Chloroflexi bacterium]|nr:hypothetical protein [Chloroflexota bacterium]
MNREEAFEVQLARWLEEGPYEAPSEPVVAALAHVRAHPGRPRTFGSLWRHAMSGIGLTHVPSQPHRGWLAAAAVIAVAAIVIVGGYGLFNLGGQAGPAAGPTPTPTAPAPSPTATAGADMATGTQSCATTTEGVTTTVNEVVQSRGEVLECTNTSSDPRLAGAATIGYNWDEHPDGLWLGWGTAELQNEGGTWSGRYAVTSTSTAGAMEFDSLWGGSDGYEGLEVLNHVRITSRYTTIRSWVLEVGPALTGTERCTTTTSGREFSVGDVTAYRGVRVTCTDRMDDPRVSGTTKLEFSIDMRADESADMWGGITLTNELGSWEGFFFGTVDAGYTTHHAQSLLRGTGEYEGLLYRLEMVSPDGVNAELSGEIIAAGGAPEQAG